MYHFFESIKCLILLRFKWQIEPALGTCDRASNEGRQSDVSRHSLPPDWDASAGCDGNLELLPLMHWRPLLHCQSPPPGVAQAHGQVIGDAGVRQISDARCHSRHGTRCCFERVTKSRRQDALVGFCHHRKDAQQKRGM